MWDHRPETPEQILAGLASHWARQANAFEDEAIALRRMLRDLLDQLDRDVGGAHEGRLTDLRRQARQMLTPPAQG